MMQKFLIIRFSSIGDIVLTSPIVRALKEQKPECEIHYITKKSYAGIVENNPHINKVYSIENEIDEVINELKNENYDFVIDLHNNIRTLRLKKKLGLPSASFPKLNLKKFFLTNFKWNSLPDVHIVERYAMTLESLNVKLDNKGLDYFIPEKDNVDLHDYSVKSNFVAFSIGAQYQTKKLPVKKIIELISKINQQVVLLGGPEDCQEGKQIEDESDNIVNLTGKLNLNQSASVLKQASVVVCHDTGLMHIASAFNKKIVSIWGNTVTELGMYPYMPSNSSNFSVHEVDLKCRPCSKIGFDKCPKKHFNCMNQQDLDDINSTIKSIKQNE